MGNKGEVYLHVGNSGASVLVLDDGFGPTLKVATGAFGNLGTEVVVKTTKEGLERVGLMIYEASRETFSEPYCHAAVLPDRRERGRGRGRQTYRSEASSEGKPPHGHTTMAEVLDMLREKARVAEDYYEEKINGRTRRLKAIDTEDGRLIIDIDDSSWVHDEDWIDSVHHLVMTVRPADVPEPTMVDIGLAILKARALFASPKMGGARLKRSELTLPYLDVEMLVALGLLYVSDGRVMFREKATLDECLGHMKGGYPVRWQEYQTATPKLPKLDITCDHKGGSEYSCEACAPKGDVDKADVAKRVRAGTLEWDPSEGGKMIATVDGKRVPVDVKP